MLRSPAATLLLLLLLAALGAAAAAVPATAETPHAQVRVIAEHQAVAPGDRFIVAFEQHLIPGWHTYWRNPGDSGEPVQLTWQLPGGVTAGPIQWPAPEAIPVGPLMNYGYADRAVFLTEIAVPEGWPAGDPLAIGVDAYWLVCEKECIPESADLALVVPTAARSTPDPEGRAVVAWARARQAEPFPAPVEYATGGESFLLSVTLGDLGIDRVDRARFFPAAWGVLEHAAEQPPTVVDDVLALRAPLGVAPPTGEISGVLRVAGTAADGEHVERALAVRATPGGTAVAAAASAGTGDHAMGLALALAAALLGGLLLNLMPCVFPVLALKAFALLAHADAPVRSRLAGGIAYTIGVLATFLALAAALLVARAGGQAAGWGFQLQHPGVIAALTLVLFAVGLNLSGVFTLGSALTRVDHRSADRGDWLGSLMTGVLAGVVAAPCTAPFMAAATGFALTRPAPEALAVFGALGLGMALPYLALTAMPRLGKLLPRPGAWTERLRQALAFPMYGAAAWLLWVLAQQAGPDRLALVLGALVLLALAAWLAGLARGGVGRIAAGLTAGLALGLALVDTGSAPDRAAPGAGQDSVAYTPATLDEYRRSGRAVFLNLTAAWCITCKVNERVALDTDAFRQALARNDAVYLRGDWTRRDPAITAILESFGRAGVPLYVVYDVRGGQRVLPQVLTPGLVADALDAATSLTIESS